MLRWLHTIAAIALWSFLLVGLLGLVDAAVIAVRHGWLGGSGLSGLLATLVPPFTLHGWFGLVTATLVALPLLLLARRRPDAHRTVSAQAIAAALSVVLMIWVGSLVHEAPIGRWWGEHVGASWLPLLVGALGLTLVLARPLGRVMSALIGDRWWPLATLLAVLIAATWQWPDHADLARRQAVDDTATSPTPAGAPNVLMVSIDALRRDKLSCIDAGAPATPHLDGLAARGHLFTNAWSVTSWTLPAMAAVMTGLPPRILGVERSLGLPEAVPTLAEGAWAAGWWTAGLVANPCLGEEFGFARGFAEFDHTDVVESLRPARRSHLARELNRYLVERTDLTDGRCLMAQASRWLGDYDRDQPFFYWIHMMDPHMPYGAILTVRGMPRRCPSTHCSTRTGSTTRPACARPCRRSRQRFWPRWRSFTTARSATPMRVWVSCWPRSRPAVMPTARGSSCSRTTARSSSNTAASSTGTACCPR